MRGVEPEKATANRFPRWISRLGGTVGELVSEAVRFDDLEAVISRFSTRCRNLDERADAIAKLVGAHRDRIIGLEADVRHLTEAGKPKPPCPHTDWDYERAVDSGGPTEKLTCRACGYIVAP